MIRIDLHIHTRYSGDAMISPKLIVDQLYAHPFIKGVAITDHDTLQGYHHAQKLATAYKDILIIPGIEVSTTQGHITILGVEEKPTYPRTVGDVVDFAKERAGTIVIPHPYRALGIGDLARNVPADAIEVLNPRSTRQENKMAEELAKERNLPSVAGSDAHRPQQMWTAYTEVDNGLDVDDVLSAIKSGLVKVKAASARLRFKC
ncbi:MAG: PHP domain-containing protein [Candidatus Bathyarchaeia archaeon]